jgi:hypothetical protein
VLSVCAAPLKTDNSLHFDEYVVYNALIAQTDFADYDHLVIESISRFDWTIEQDVHYLQTHFSALSPATFDSLFVRNEKAMALEPSRFQRPITLIKHSQLASLKSPGQPVDEMNRRYPGTPRILSLSRVALDPVGPYALLYYQTYCGLECGEGTVVSFKLVDGNWVLQRSLLLWVS